MALTSVRYNQHCKQRKTSPSCGSQFHPLFHLLNAKANNKYSVPPNLSFQVDDLEDDWTFSQPFDFIFSRMMTGAIDDWPRFFRQSLAGLSPGGWLECHDICLPARSDDGTLRPDSALAQWSDRIFEATALQGRPCNGARLYRQQMIDAGFVNVREIRFKWPMNRWPADPHYKDLGL